MIRPFAATVSLVAALSAVAACGGDDPAVLAQQACAASPAGASLTSTNGEYTAAQMEEATKNFNSAADLSAQAAAGDRRWETLSTAYSTMNDLLTEGGPLLVAGASTWTEQEREEARTIAAAALDTEATLRAQCRIAAATE